MSVIKPRTTQKHLVRHITRLYRENNETLFAYAKFLGEPTEYVLNQLVETVLGQGQGLPGLARAECRIVRAEDRRAIARAIARRSARRRGRRRATHRRAAACA